MQRRLLTRRKRRARVCGKWKRSSRSQLPICPLDAPCRALWSGFSFCLSRSDLPSRAAQVRSDEQGDCRECNRMRQNQQGASASMCQMSQKSSQLFFAVDALLSSCHSVSLPARDQPPEHARRSGKSCTHLIVRMRKLQACQELSKDVHVRTESLDVEKVPALVPCTFPLGV